MLLIGNIPTARPEEEEEEEEEMDVNSYFDARSRLLRSSRTCQRSEECGRAYRGLLLKHRNAIIARYNTRRNFRDEKRTCRTAANRSTRKVYDDR